MAGEVKSAQVTISEHWPDHVYHKTVGKAPRWDAELGVVCACTEVLGWPDPDHPETLSQYTKRVAAERVDAASAPGRVKGAFGEYPAQGAGRPSTGAYPDGDLHESTSDEDPGPSEPDEDVDWGEPPEDEPEPERLEIDDAAWQDQAVRDAVRSTGARSMHEVSLPAANEDVQSSGPVDFGNLVDEVTGPETVFEADADRYPPDEAQAGWAGPGEVVGAVIPPEGDDGRADVADMLPWDGTGERPERWQDSDGIGWVPPEGATAREIADSGLYPVPEGEVAVSEREYAEAKAAEVEVGRDLVPYAGTPIFPTDAQELDPLIGRLAPLDPTLPYTPADVELKIVEILRQLENSEVYLRQQVAREHQATHNYSLRHALAIRDSTARAQDQRNAEATLATERELKEMNEAKALTKCLRDSQHNLRSQLSGFQSVARSLGVSLTNALDGREMPKRIESHREPPEPAPWEYR
jgi:hypothetical protein